MRSTRLMVGLLGVLCLAGTAACGSGEQRVAGRVAAQSSAACAQIQQQISAGQAVDVGAAKQCDQTEFAALEQERQAARARGEQPAVLNSKTCEAVNARAAQGDPALNFDLAFTCRQRERFANAKNAQTGAGPANKVTSLCLGARAKKARGETVDAFTETFCGPEEAAAAAQQSGSSTGGANPGPAQGSTSPEASTAPAAPAPDQGAVGQVVCPGSTVTLSGEAGAPAASSNQLPVGTRIKVTNLDNNKSTTVEVTSVSGSCALLNNAAFEQVREPGKNLIRRARIERLA
ncbi:hypothetical protein ACGFNU_28345 [Spirillospora sp. NPDC048911]|uniref:hypothetical protein n=1 Tax=Spirillospora sp. NPDC048911 TaxID=3364527 RepID=UPI00371D4405